VALLQMLSRELDEVDAMFAADRKVLSLLALLVQKCQY
jgi:hypothetical protein